MWVENWIMRTNCGADERIFQQQKRTKWITGIIITLLLVVDSIISVQAEKPTITRLLDTIPYSQVKAGSLFYKHKEGYSAGLSQNSNFSVEINGLLARIDVTQTFKNESNDTLEAIYVFPLSEDAAVDHMTMEIGKRLVVGEIKEKQKAKVLYQTAMKKGKKASLVSQQRPNIFTTKVANIAPNEVIKIKISYLQAVNFVSDRFSLRLPLTITERFIPQPQQQHQVFNPENTTLSNEAPAIQPDHNPKKMTQAAIYGMHGWLLDNSRVPDGSLITPPQVKHSSSQKATIKLKINSQLPLVNVGSLYHRVQQSTQGNNVLIQLKDSSISLDKDFELHWQLAEGETPAAAFFSQSDDDFHYGLLMVVPPQSEQQQIIAKEVIYIIDTSGSMGGVAIEQAKKALTQAITMLNDDDHFNIIEFNSYSQKLFPHSKKANSHFRDRATNWISLLQAGGGTQMVPAIELALSQKAHRVTDDNIQQRQVVFITDGAVGNEVELFNVIEKKLANTRLHTIGIGSAPNGYFMNQAAEIGRGTFRYIGNINEVHHEMTQLFDEINRPMMTNIAIQWPSNDIEMFPQHIPDLYAGNPLLVAIKWAKDKDALMKDSVKVNITGQLASQLWQQQLKVSPVGNLGDAKAMSEGAERKLNNGVGTWWARKKIKHLNTLYRRSTTEQKNALQEEITGLALHHQLLSKFTSFVAIEKVTNKLADNETKPKRPRSVAIPNLAPHGSAHVVPMSNTALGLSGYLYLALFMLMLSAILLFMPSFKKTQTTLKH